MSKACYFLTMLLFTIVIFTYSQDDFVPANRSMFVQCHNSLPAFDTSVIARVAENLHMERFDKMHSDFMLAFHHKKLKFLMAYAEMTISREYLHPSLYPLKSMCSEGDSIRMSGFRVYVPDVKRVRKNLYKFLMSAYEQESNSALEIKDYLVLPDKPEDKIKRMAWVSPAYAMKLMHEDNPFTGLKAPLRVGYHLLDAFGLAYVIGAPIFGKNLKNKLGLSALGLVFLLEIRIFTAIGMKKEITGYNLIKNSGYRVPNTMDF